MKLFSYLLVACAGLGLFACNTENDPVIENGDGVTKSVSLKLNGISGSLNTKAVEPGTAVAGKIVLKDLKIVFYDKFGTDGPIYRIEEFDPTDAAKWTALTGTPTAPPAGYIFHDLDPKVNAVLVVGNWKNEGKSFTWTNVTSIKSSVLLAANENKAVSDFSSPTPVTSTKNYVTLWGQSMADFATGPADPNHPNTTLYTTSVNIKPLVSRFEIGDIQCTDLGNIYNRFDLKGIGLIDMSLTNTIAQSEIPGVLPPRLVINTHIVESSPGTGQYLFGDPSNAISWAYNSISPLVNISSSATKYNPDGTTAAPNGTKKFVYNFFPDPTGFPNIKLVLDNVMLKTGPESSFDYVVTANFKDGRTTPASAIIPTAGKIYTINLAFKEENIGPWDPDKFKCVIVDVNVADWEIIPLVPEFK
jgi:hypothetical protein